MSRSILLLLTVVMFQLGITSFAGTPGYARPVWKELTISSPDTIIEHLPGDVDEFRIHLRFTPGHYTERSQTQLKWTSGEDTLIANVVFPAVGKFETELISKPHLTLERKSLYGTVVEVDRDMKLSKSNDKEVSLRFTGRDGKMLVEMGYNKDGEASTVSVPGAGRHPSEIEITFRNIAELNRYQFKYRRFDDFGTVSGDLLSAVLSHNNRWIYYDRDTEDLAGRIGGKYQFALVSDGVGGYNLIYISGAEIAPQLWQTGDIKAYLAPTSADGQYELYWLDAFRNLVEGEAYAIMGEDKDTIISMHFPERSVQIRLIRMHVPVQD